MVAVAGAGNLATSTKPRARRRCSIISDVVTKPPSNPARSRASDSANGSLGALSNTKGRNLVVRKLCESGWSLYASEAYSARHPLAGASIVLRSREVTDMIAAAASGLGLAVVPCLLGDAEPALRRITRRVVATRRSSLVYRREARLSENVQAVVRFVTQVVLAHADEIRGASRPSAANPPKRWVTSAAPDGARAA